MKKGQISIFIILGLIILLVVALWLYAERLKTDSLNPKIPSQYIIKSSVKPVKIYVEECLSKVSMEPITQIGLNGGTLEPASFRWYDGEKYNYLASAGPGAGYIQSLVLRQDMEKELEDEIRNNLPGCIDLSVFERQGFSINTGPMRVNVTIGREDVRIRLDYPIMLEKDGNEMSSAEYDADIAKPLGLLYDKSIEIINSENSKGYFDQVDYMFNNDNQILIEKHRPYPDTVYNLSLDSYTFRFALGGKSTVSTPGYVADTAENGCCYNLYDKDCYKDVLMETCEAKNGIYDPNPECVCPETDDLNTVTCNGKECKDCESTYDYVTGQFTGPKRKNGESWCDYDSYAGKGYDYVGSRHYLHYCIDGKEYVEECRDYREELCTEETVVRENETYSKGMCRPNRWQDCSSCKTEECCEDLRYRDCSWKDWLNTEGQCVPQVPPGLRFWESGSEICSRATETKVCAGISCPNIWVDDTAVYCYMQGDCGNYRNIEDKISYGGFFNSDLQDKVRDYVYLKDGETKKGNDYTIDLGIANREQAQLISSPVLGAQDNFIRLYSTGLGYINTLSSLSVSDFLNPNIDDTNLKITDIALCDVWQAPWGGDDCSKCTSDKFRPCTEYKCRSLGKQCEYEEIKGVGHCYVKDPDDTSPPQVSIDPSATGNGFKTENSHLDVASKTYYGYEITPAIRPFQLLTIGINTSEDTICRLNYLPRLKFISLPSYYFGSPEFSRTHNITIRIPGRIDIPKKALDIFNMTSIGQLVDILENPRRFLETYKTRYATQMKLFRIATGKDAADIMEPYVEKIIAAISDISDLVPLYRELLRTVLGSFEKGHYYLFIECSDRAGNTNPEEPYIGFSVESNMNDNEPPAILGFDPENSSFIESSAEKKEVFLYLDEPAECRYDDKDSSFELMKGRFDCPFSRYNMDPKFDGSYRCSAMLNTTEEETAIYIRCRDNPLRIFEYLLEIETGKTAGIKGAAASEYLNVSAPGSVFASANMLKSSVIFMVQESHVDLHLYTDDLMNCTYSYADKKAGLDNCSHTDKLELGQYMCTAGIELEENSSVLENRSFVLKLVPENKNNEDYAAVSGSEIRINYSRLTDGQAIVFINKSMVNAIIHLDGDYSCAYATEVDSMDRKMSCISRGGWSECDSYLDGNSTYNITCTENPGGIGGGVHDINIQCRMPVQYQQNTDKKSAEYVIRKSPELIITDYGPSQESDTARPVLYVDTNNNPGVRCGYYKDLMLGTLLMRNTTATHHEITIDDAAKGYNTYYVQCWDAYGNTVLKQIEFYVIG